MLCEIIYSFCVFPNISCSLVDEIQSTYAHNVDANEDVQFNAEICAPVPSKIFREKFRHTKWRKQLTDQFHSTHASTYRPQSILFPPDDATYNFVEFVLSCFEHTIRCFGSTREKCTAKTKWILNLNFFLFRSRLWYFSHQFRTHIFPGIVHRFKLILVDTNKIDEDEENGRKFWYLLGSFPLFSFPLIVVSTFFFHFLFYGFAFRFWLSVPKHNVFFCYRLKVNFLHFFVCVCSSHVVIGFCFCIDCRPKRMNEIRQKCSRIYNIADWIFLSTLTVKLNEWDMLRTGFCAASSLLPCHTKYCTQPKRSEDTFWDKKCNANTSQSQSRFNCDGPFSIVIGERALLLFFFQLLHGHEHYETFREIPLNY